MRRGRRKLDLNDDVRDIVSAIQESTGFGYNKLAERLGISPTMAKRILTYPKESGITLGTLSQILTSLDQDPVAFFESHPRYGALASNTLLSILRRNMTEEQIKDLAVIAAQLDAVGLLAPVLSALKTFGKSVTSKRKP